MRDSLIGVNATQCHSAHLDRPGGLALQETLEFQEQQAWQD